MPSNQSLDDFSDGESLDGIVEPSDYETYHPYVPETADERWEFLVTYNDPGQQFDPILSSFRNRHSSFEGLPRRPLALPMKPVCESCEGASSRNRDTETWYCTQCDCNFCEECWAMQRAHLEGLKGWIDHEKANLSVVRRYHSILTAPADSAELREQHLHDRESTWFGVVRDERDKPVFVDYGRYSTIISDTTTGEFPMRYPQLVSFIGQTGAGTSTIVNMLIDQQARMIDETSELMVPSPVVASARHIHAPTSSDVHLYADPSTCHGQFPMLYADCEGLGGGEIQPISAQMCNFLGKGAPAGSSKRQESTAHRMLGRIGLQPRGTQHTLAWVDSPEKQERRYAVEELYPRLLYTFSDTVVYVLRNKK